MTKKTPHYSIIIPTYARPKQLVDCLRSLTHLDYPRHRFEVIVVDDGSYKPLDAVVYTFRDQLNLTLLSQRNAGPAAARNKGASEATGKIFVFTDDDCLPHPKWLRVLSEYFESSPYMLVGGRTINALPDNPYLTASQILIEYLYSYYNVDRDEARFFASNNFAVPADGFNTIQGFDPTYISAAAEDRDFCDRWLSYGYKMSYAERALVYHAHSLTLGSFWRQHFKYGRGAYRFHMTRKKRGLLHTKIEPLSFYIDLLCFPLHKKPGSKALLHTFLLFSSQIANAAGFFWEWARRR